MAQCYIYGYEVPGGDAPSCVDAEYNQSYDFLTTDSATCSDDDKGKDEHCATMAHIDDKEFPAIKKWLLEDDDSVFKKYLSPWLQAFTTQMSAVTMQQTFMFGTFLDAKEQMTVQRTFQRLTAAAHKDYQPSMGMCTIGTNVRSLAAAQDFAEFNTASLARAGQARSTGSIDTNATEGEQSDRAGRLTQLRSRYCDPSDNNGGLGPLCTNGAPASATLNRDIDYGGVIDRPATLDIDYSRATRSTDETDTIALGDNLYGHQAMFRLPEISFDQDKTRILDFRSVIAQRNVAAASYYTIAGLKSHGSPTDGSGTAPYLTALLEQLGVTASDAATMLGDRPSYDAQMEILTKKIYQNPAFYSELYETPTNVARQKVAMQAVGLMQNFDVLQSYLRTEMMLSQMLELEVIKQQNAVQNEIGTLSITGEKGSKG